MHGNKNGEAEAQTSEDIHYPKPTGYLIFVLINTGFGNTISYSY